MREKINVNFEKIIVNFPKINVKFPKINVKFPRSKGNEIFPRSDKLDRGQKGIKVNRLRGSI